MSETRYCALITLDETGHPQARTMDPFPPDSNMTVWFGTNSDSRKVKEILNNSKATLYYEAPDARGYVVLKGNAFMVDDSDKKLKHWKPEWKIFYPESKENYTLIKFIPEKLEIVDYKNKIVGDSDTWKVPGLKL
jgi:general stress protein 26